MSSFYLEKIRQVSGGDCVVHYALIKPIPFLHHNYPMGDVQIHCI